LGCGFVKDGVFRQILNAHRKKGMFGQFFRIPVSRTGTVLEHGFRLREQKRRNAWRKGLPSVFLKCAETVPTVSEAIKHDEQYTAFRQTGLQDFPDNSG
jgi:hypothetical protein